MENHLKQDKKGCVITWKIENFLWNAKARNEFLSKTFEFPNNCSNTQWLLLMYPSKNSEKISCHLKGFGKRKQGEVSLCVQFSCITSDGESERVNCIGKDKYAVWEWKDLLKDKLLYFPNDSFTVRCRLWEDTSQEQPSVEYNALTCFEVTKILFQKNFLGVSALCSHDEIKSVPLEGFKLEISLFKVENSDSLSVKLKYEGVNNCYKRLYCQLIVLHSRGVPVFEVEDLKNSLSFELKIPNIIKLKEVMNNVYFPDDTLPLQFKLILHTGRESSQLTKTKMIQLMNSTDKSVNDPIATELKYLYSKNKFSDVMLRSGNKVFKAHKILLSARSPVFAAMFDSDMAEKESGVVIVEDVDAPVLDKMLLFMYTGTVSDLNEEIAMKLLSASDKYQIISLKRQIETHLESFLSTSNACQILLLADIHYADSLKRITKEFICGHHYDIFGNEVWKKFTIEHGVLASEVLQMLSLRYLKF